MISIIIPAFNSARFVDDCIASIKGNIEHEILIGVDNCQDTFDNAKQYASDNVHVYFFTNNVGPFVVKNTLVDLAKYENILFFDVDDILIKGTLEAIVEALENKDYVKLNYVDFLGSATNKKVYQKILNNATIAIKKSVFNSLNGFQPWRCGADTEFAYRLIHNNAKEGKIIPLCYYRRLHNQNLTVSKDTNYQSPMRKYYTQLINNNLKLNSWPNPETKITQEYVHYTTTN